MPNGDVELYGVWKYYPNDVTLTLAKPAGYTGDKMPTWKSDQNSPYVCSVPYGMSLDEWLKSEEKSWADFKPEMEGYRFNYWAYKDANDVEQQFYVTAPVTAPRNLYPVFTKTADNTVSVDIYYEYKTTVEGAEQTVRVKDRTEKLTIGTTPMITLKTKPADNLVEGMKLDPSYYFEEINDTWKDNHKNSTTGKYELVFRYVDASDEWRYNIEYYLMLKPVRGDTKERVLILTETKTVNTEFAFEAFYALPEGMQGGYVFDKLQTVKNGTANSESKDAAVLLKQNEVDTVRVFVEPNISGELMKEMVRTYNGLSQALSREYIESKLPGMADDLEVGGSTNDVLKAENIKYHTDWAYYAGNDASISENIISDDDLINAGIYRLEIHVTLVLTIDGSDKSYIFWDTPSYGSGTRPGIVFTINRRDVTITSDDVIHVFYDNSSNAALFNDDDTPKDPSSMPDHAKLSDVAMFESFDGNKGVVVSITPLVGDDASVITNLKNSMQSGISVAFSADAFRRSPTSNLTTATQWTPNVFSYSLPSALDPNNFNIYKQYGNVYLWASKSLYDSYKSSH